MKFRKCRQKSNVGWMSTPLPVKYVYCMVNSRRRTVQHTIPDWLRTPLVSSVRETGVTRITHVVFDYCMETYTKNAKWKHRNVWMFEGKGEFRTIVNPDRIWTPSPSGQSPLLRRVFVLLRVFSLSPFPIVLGPTTLYFLPTQCVLLGVLSGSTYYVSKFSVSFLNLKSRAQDPSISSRKVPALYSTLSTIHHGLFSPHCFYTVGL